MREHFLNYKAVPRWVIQVIDLAIITTSFALSYFILKHFEFKAIYRGHFFLYIGTYSLLTISVFYLMRIHTGLIRYSNSQDIVRIFSAILISSLLYPVVVHAVLYNFFSIEVLDLSKILLINFFICSSFMVLFRTTVKETFNFARRVSSSPKEKVVIFGTGNNAVLIKQAMEAAGKDDITVFGFLDTVKRNINNQIQQKRVFHARELVKLRDKHGVQKVIMMNADLGSVEKKTVINECLRLGIKVVTVPPPDQWVYGKLSLRQIRDLNIEDLLQREPIVINNTNISEELQGKRILVTGAAGSIGSELVRQILRYNPGQLILCDQAESALHDIQLEVQERYADANLQIFIGNIQNFKRMQVLFREYKPQIIFHAAAYKHVPMMENNPSEAVLTNVMGSKNIADLAVIHKAEKFIMVSTDKAVNPTNVMGASKRIAEMYTQSLNNYADPLFQVEHGGSVLQTYIQGSKTKFITTRFGNVLDSNGSVVPRFRSQIAKGGPITVTDPEITRYFMTIPEAVQLVLEAGAMGKGGEIFVFDMGQPVRIANLAKQMIKLAGLVLDEDIKIVYTGLRPGEKLYEELLNEKEKTLPTHHSKIKIARVSANNYEQVLYDVEELILLGHHEDDELLVQKMKEIVPEFVSNNSRFQKLDADKANSGKRHTAVNLTIG